MILTINPLAADGGSRIRTEPWKRWPYFEPADVEVVSSVLASGRVNYWTGNEGRQFEAEFAAYVGVPYAIALANGTAALELALHALGIGPGDEVIVPSRTFIATASCVVARGARPVVADIDPDSQNLSAATVQAVMTPRTRAIIPVHLAGRPCEMDELLDLASRCGLYVIEDCAQAHGAHYKGRPVGSLGHVAAFSFCQDKIVTTGGEGGMFVTSDEAMWRKAWAYKDHGKDYDLAHEQSAGHAFRWLHTSFGSNWRLTEMQSALGRRLLTRLEAQVEQRRSNAAYLDRAFAGLPGLRVAPVPEHLRHSYYKYYAFIDPTRLRREWTRDRILACIQAEGVPCFSGSCGEIYLEKAFPEEWRPKERLPIAVRLGETSLMFQVHPTLDVSDMRHIAMAVEKVLTHAMHGGGEAPALEREAEEACAQ